MPNIGLKIPEIACEIQNLKKVEKFVYRKTNGRMLSINKGFIDTFTHTYYMYAQEVFYLLCL